MRLKNSLRDVLPDAGFGLYVHWPFCQSKCPYCDFNSHVSSNIDQNTWADAFVQEIDRLGKRTGDRVLRSIFFGGGTPSLMNVETVDRIINKAAKTWRFENDLEVSLEANPSSVEAARFEGFRQAGVNRVSIGVQALSDADLKMLGRLHDVNEALAAVEIAQKTFERISFDLIYARQHQTREDWERELSRALALGPDHLSLYQLTIEDGTAFNQRYQAGKLPGLPNEDLGADLWDITQELCQGAGLFAYEVSNHAKAGYECRHNLIYWNSGDWLGIGPGAHGRLTASGKRLEAVAWKMPGKWLSAVLSSGSGDEIERLLDPAHVLEERLMMGLRLADGIEMPAHWIDERKPQIEEMIDLNLIELANHKVMATSTGRVLLNAVLQKLL